MTNEELTKENDILKGICAFENINCIYCGLPKEEMSKCSSGFPGCARSDDMMCAPAHIQLKYGL